MIHGLETDPAGRCVHYHLACDIAGLKCGECTKYYACYKCHDALEPHVFAACDPQDTPVVCGICSRRMSFTSYKRGFCPDCKNAFNPKCSTHEQIYFK